MVVANADEPLIVWAALPARQVVWVDTATTWTQDASLCPNATAISSAFSQTHAGLGGDWHCTRLRPRPA